MYTSNWRKGKTLTEQLYLYPKSTCTYMKSDLTESNLLTFTLITLT